MTFLKNKLKKFEKLHILFFFNSKRNRHIHLGPTALAIFLIIILAIPIYITISALNISFLEKENNDKSSYIHDLKMQIINTHIAEIQSKENEEKNHPKKIAKKSAETENIAKTNTEETAQSEQPANTQAPTENSKDIRFEKPVFEDAERGKIKMSFAIISTDETERKHFSGRICAIVYATATKALKLGFPEKIITANTPILRCEQGLFVKFSRLRPTSIYLNTAEKSLKDLSINKVTFIFENILDNSVSYAEFTDF